MPTPAEKKALGFVAAVFAAGVVVRAAGIGGAEPATDREMRALGRQIVAVDSVRKGGEERSRRRGSAASRAAPSAGGSRRRSAAGAATPSVPPPPPNAVFGPRRGARGGGAASSDAFDAAPVDLDRATAAEIERLPRIGPALAQRIVEDRRRLGPFGSIEGLQRVRGIGPALAETLRPRVTFSTAGRPYNARSGAGSTPSGTAGPTPRGNRPRRGDAGPDGT